MPTGAFQSTRALPRASDAPHARLMTAQVPGGHRLPRMPLSPLAPRTCGRPSEPSSTSQMWSRLATAGWCGKHVRAPKERGRRNRRSAVDKGDGVAEVLARRNQRTGREGVVLSSVQVWCL